MHHLYPLTKGDPLCPLGFHPQVRWPTRCKRCFRDYKEHGGKKRDDDFSLRRDDTTASTPSLTSWGSTRSKSTETENRRSWASSSNLAFESNNRNNDNYDNKNPSSWISTPDLANLNDDTQANIPTVSITLPKKRKELPSDTGQKTNKDNISTNKIEKYNKTDNLAARAKKLQAIKESSQERSKRIHIKEIKTLSDESTNHDVQFLIQVKSKKPKDDESKMTSSSDSAESEDDAASIAATDTTDNTLVDNNESELREQFNSLKQELDVTKAKCDRLEREKSDILLRRLAAMETTTSKTTATEVLKLQQKCNDMQSQLEDYRDEKKSLALRVKELEEELEARPTAQSAQKIADELRSKLLAAETLCEELMDENEDMKKELRDLEEQMDELQDNFREDQAVEYTSLKKELEQTTKNCRILSFKLRKAERKSEQLETEKLDVEKKLKEISGGQTTLSNLERIKHLEQELKVANEVSIRLQKELEETNNKLSKAEEATKSSTTKKKAPMLGSLGKIPSGDGKISRESLTRGGSQDDPAQLLRDLQDSLEREADLREQLKFAEEEGQNLRKKASRVEDDNESLVLQLKKMATRARSRKLSPTNARLTPEPNEKTEGNLDEEDPTELKLLLELNEQEASVLRKKIEELEGENERMKRKTKDLQDKLTAKTTTKKNIFGTDKGNSTIHDKKLKVLEDEANDLRKKLIEKERDCERLHAELSLNQKRSKGMQRSKSLDLDQQTLDLKRQLQVIEQEANVLRTKVQSLESENEKLITENKKLQLLRGTKNLKSDKSTELYIDKIAVLEVELNDANKRIKELENTTSKTNDNNKLKQVEEERDKLADTLKKLKEDAGKSFKNRTPKQPTTFTSKEQLRTMINDLESEISEIMLVLKTTQTSKSKLEEEIKELKLVSKNKELNNTLKDLDELKDKLNRLQKELDEEKRNVEKEKDKYTSTNKILIKTKENLNKANEEKKQLKEQIEKSKENYTKAVEEKGKLDQEIEKLKTEMSNTTAKFKDLNKLKEKIDNLESELNDKNQQVIKLKTELEEKSKLSKDVTSKTKKIAEMEKKLNEFEEKNKRMEKTKDEQIKELEQKIKEEANKLLSKEQLHKESSEKWKSDQKSLNTEIEELNEKIKTLETTINTKNQEIKQLEESLHKERESPSNKKTDNTKELNNLRDELNKNKLLLSEIETKLESAQKSKKTAEDKLKKLETEKTKEKTGLEKKITELENDLQSEKKKIDVIKTNHEKENKNRELELNTLKDKIRTLETTTGTGNKKIAAIKQEYQDRITKLEEKIAAAKTEYDDLTAKYEILEEEHVVMKAKLVTEKESLNNQLLSTNHKLEDMEIELEALREEYTSKQDILIKEKNDINNKLQELEKKNGTELERTRIKAMLEDRQSELEQIRKEYSVVNDQLEYMRRENDELRKKLDDYDKVNKIQRNISADSTAMEKEIKQLKTKLANSEKSKKTDLAQYKMRYESQIVAVSEEIQSLQNQVMRFKRERDTYKHMLEGAQKTIGDLKSNNKTDRESRTSINSYDELEESRSKIATLEQQISCMEDELSEARLESSKLKTDLVSERSSWEVKLSELHSRVNELEEEKILSSGRTKIAGLRTRMELAWHKEREEQQRLLQETATLARDLRQTLFEVERERDKERLEAKRKQDQLKKMTEEEQDENKKKLTELQCDLLELRDAHAKLRTTNEKLRLEKERYEKEREKFRSIVNDKRRTEQEDDKRITALVEQVDSLMQLAPDLLTSKGKSGEVYTPTPPRRTKGPKSRESSPALERVDSNAESSQEDRKNQIHLTMQRLVNATEELKRYQKLNEEDRERERIKRTIGTRRATSTEHENIPSTRKASKGFSRNGTNSSSLHRRSLSLEYTTLQNEQNIWKGDDDSMSSLQSLDTASDIERWNRRDVSLDSRLSGGSTQSEVSGEKKKKKSLIGKMKKLVKSRSIDDQDPGIFSSSGGLSSKPSSNVDMTEDTRGSKKDLKDRLTGMFKRSGSSSRGNSMERQVDGKHETTTRSTQRPLMPNGSHSNISRASPSYPDTPKTSKKSK